jgi:NAD(P)-dependent dehydrogenase (short-subunit alcohol dehydrogenase family)
MTGKTCLVTGASTGIGKQTALGLARRGATVHLLCRDRAKGEAALAAVKAAGAAAGSLLFLADLSSMAEVRRVAAEIRAQVPRLDVLVNNAGAIFGDRQVTVDGYERTFALNHLSYFLLTLELLPLVEKSAPARIVNVSSEAHRMGGLDFDDLQSEKSYGQLKAYGRSKLANILFTTELARRLAERGVTGVTANSLHPGSVASEFGKTGKGLYRALANLVRGLLKTPEQGARTSLLLAAEPSVEGVTGAYYVGKKAKKPSGPARDAGAARRLWEVSEQLVAKTAGAGGARQAG